MSNQDSAAPAIATPVPMDFGTPPPADPIVPLPIPERVTALTESKKDDAEDDEEEKDPEEKAIGIVVGNLVKKGHDKDGVEVIIRDLTIHDLTCIMEAARKKEDEVKSERKKKLAKKFVTGERVVWQPWEKGKSQYAGKKDVKAVVLAPKGTQVEILIDGGFNTATVDPERLTRGWPGEATPPTNGNGKKEKKAK